MLLKILRVGWGFHFWLTWNNRNDIYIPGRNNKKIRQMCKTLVFKTLNIRQWRTMIPERWGKNKVSSVLYCVLSLCLTLCNPMDCSQSGSSVQGIFQEEYWSGLPFPTEGRPSQTRDRFRAFCDSCVGRQILYHWATWEAPAKLYIT